LSKQFRGEWQHDAPPQTQIGGGRKGQKVGATRSRGDERDGPVAHQRVIDAASSFANSRRWKSRDGRIPGIDAPSRSSDDRATLHTATIQRVADGHYKGTKDTTRRLKDKTRRREERDDTMESFSRVFLSMF